MADRRSFLKGILVSGGALTMLQVTGLDTDSPKVTQTPLVPDDMNDPEVRIIFEAMYEAVDGQTPTTQLAVKFREILRQKERDFARQLNENNLAYLRQNGITKFEDM